MRGRLFRIGRLSVGKECQSKSLGWILASWAYETGYWRWALYWIPRSSYVGLRRSRSVRGAIYPNFGFELGLGFAHVSFATQPPCPGMKKAKPEGGAR